MSKQTHLILNKAAAAQMATEILLEDAKLDPGNRRRMEGALAALRELVACVKEIPREPAAAPAPIPECPAEKRRDSDAGRRILVVDDEVGGREMTAQILEREGYSVLAVGTGREALEKIDTWHPELVVTDYEMPDITGLELLKNLSTRDEHGVTIFLSAHEDGKIIADCLDAGADDFLKKPIRPDELLARVRARLR